MKQVTVKDRIVETPWLRIEEAAAYCGLSRSAFDERSQHVPHAGDDRTRLYHVSILDKWVQGELPNAPFIITAKKHNQRRRRMSSCVKERDPIVLYDPVSGKAYPSKITTKTGERA